MILSVGDIISIQKIEPWQPSRSRFFPNAKLVEARNLEDGELMTIIKAYEHTNSPIVSIRVLDQNFIMGEVHKESVRKIFES